jgi:hypothetical protein
MAARFAEFTRPDVETCPRGALIAGEVRPELDTHLERVRRDLVYRNLIGRCALWRFASIATRRRLEGPLCEVA